MTNLRCALAYEFTVKNKCCVLFNKQVFFVNQDGFLCNLDQQLFTEKELGIKQVVNAQLWLHGHGKDMIYDLNSAIVHPVDQQFHPLPNYGSTPLEYWYSEEQKNTGVYKVSNFELGERLFETNNCEFALDELFYFRDYSKFTLNCFSTSGLVWSTNIEACFEYSKELGYWGPVTVIDSKLILYAQSRDHLENLTLVLDSTTGQELFRTNALQGISHIHKDLLYCIHKKEILTFHPTDFTINTYNFSQQLGSLELEETFFSAEAEWLALAAKEETEDITSTVVLLNLQEMTIDWKKRLVTVEKPQPHPSKSKKYAQKNLETFNQRYSDYLKMRIEDIQMNGNWLTILTLGGNLSVYTRTNEC